VSKKQAAFAVILLLCMVFALGPSLPQKVEIEKLREAVVMGVDRAEEGVRLTVLLRVTSPGDDESLRVELRKAQGRTMEEAVRELNRLSNKGLYFSHMKHVLFGRQTAEKGLENYMGFFAEHHEIRMQTDLIVCEGEAEAFLTALSENKDQDPVDSLKELLQNRSTRNESHRFTLMEYMQWEKGRLRDVCMPYMTLAPGQDKDRIAKLLGYAVYDGAGQLAFCLQDEEARMLTLLKGDLKEGLFVLEREKSRFSVIVERVNRQLSVGAGGENRAMLKLVLFCRLFDGDVPVETAARVLEETMDVKARALLMRLKEAGTDVMGFRQQYFWKNPVSDAEKAPAFSGMELDLKLQVVMQDDRG